MIGNVTYICPEGSDVGIFKCVCLRLPGGTCGRHAHPTLELSAHAHPTLELNAEALPDVGKIE